MFNILQSHEPTAAIRVNSRWNISLGLFLEYYFNVFIHLSNMACIILNGFYLI